MARCSRKNNMWYKVWQLLPTGRWFFPGTPVSSTNKTDRHEVTWQLMSKTSLLHMPVSNQEVDFFLTAYVEVFTFTYARFKPGSRFLPDSLCRSLHFYIIMPVSNQEVEYHRVNLYRCLHFVLSCFKWGGWVVLLSFIVERLRHKLSGRNLLPGLKRA
jgi:hypothetical protein